jgi:hypothetical protein
MDVAAVAKPDGVPARKPQVQTCCAPRSVASTEAREKVFCGLMRVSTLVTLDP